MLPFLTHQRKRRKENVPFGTFLYLTQLHVNPFSLPVCACGRLLGFQQLSNNATIAKPWGETLCSYSYMRLVAAGVVGIHERGAHGVFNRVLSETKER